MAVNLYKHRESNIRKTWILFAGFLVFVIGVGWIFSQVYGSNVILIVAVVFSIVMNVLAYWYSDKLVLKMSRAEPVEKSKAPELYNVVENLAITAGLPTPKIYLVRDPSPNAFATGRDPKHAVVAVTTGLLERLDRTELEGVISHELSHIGNRDMLLSTVVVVLVGFVALLSDFFMRSLWFRGMFGDQDRRGGGGTAMILIGIIFSILAPLSAMLIQLAISRKREFLADASGAMLTRYPEGLAKALEKISAYSRPMRSANNATAHLWISDPHGKKHNVVAKLFMTHPPTEERVARLRGINI
ncbi:MAG: M48 family metallopeptidase [Candidatus Niyogibacteria bacterium]|nr:MAG: M48 family metallopeptidase [Candidatus Niyogibacteria bacterium]